MTQHHILEQLNAYKKLLLTHTWFDTLASGCSIVICLKCSFLGLHEKVNHVRSHNASLFPY